jgi:hypothetical protein
VTASRARRRARRLALALAACLPACGTPGGLPPESAFLPPVGAPPPPDVADRTTARLARAALLSDEQATARALRSMHAIETVLAATEDPRTGLVPAAIDLRNTTLDDRRAYRDATEALLDRDDLAPALRKRLELARDDDPLELAGDRIRDARLIEFAAAFNTLAEPVGRSLMSSQLAPYRLGRSLLNYAIEVYTREELSLQRRQALQHWKEFLAREPDAPEAEAIEPRVREGQARFLRLQRDRSLRVASKALEHGDSRLALVYADRALRFAPEDPEAWELREEAARRLLALRADQDRSVSAETGAAGDLFPSGSRELALALLLPGGDVAGAAVVLRRDGGPLADEAGFAEATALGEAGDPDAMWELLDELAEADHEDSNMARHAQALVNSPDQNSWGAFQAARRKHRFDIARFIVLGPFFQGMPDRGLPGKLEWIVDAPSLAESVAATPMRLINAPWAQALPSERVTAAYARRNLAREPDGPHAEEVRDWLEGYERDRGNWVAVLAVAEQRSDPDLEELAELRERAAAQYLDAAIRERNLGLRIGMYQQIGVIYPGSGGARTAAQLAHIEATEATAQRIRLSREFLVENREVSGPKGLALRPELLDGDAANAELHPAGVTLIGARGVRLHYLAASGDEDDPPRDVDERLGHDHLARVVSQIEEVTYRNMLLDPLDDVTPDAQRDLFFERVRLGLADSPDRRPEAISTYTYRGLRERYGIVRARDPILPFDLVLQGSLSDFSVGAFPRIRKPRETPDAILYR